VKGSAVLSVANAAVVLSGGDLPATLTFPVNARNSLTFEGTDLNLSIKSSNGRFTGWFINPNTGRKVTMSGVVLTNENSAFGFFLGSDESGAVQLESQ
jgi:hypothetical protein